LNPKWKDPASPAKSREAADIIYTCIERASIGAWDNLYDNKHDPEYLDSLSAPWRELFRDLDAE
jgi:hypothetical protein